MADIEALNAKYGVQGHVSVVVGNGGQARVDLKLAGASAAVYLNGATVTSFKPTAAHEVMWVRYVLHIMSLFQGHITIKANDEHFEQQNSKLCP